MVLTWNESLLAVSKAHEPRFPCSCTCVRNASSRPGIHPLCWSLLCYTWSARVYKNVARNPAATATATICAVDALSLCLVMLNYGGSEFTDVLKRLKTVCFLLPEQVRAGKSATGWDSNHGRKSTSVVVWLRHLQKYKSCWKFGWNADVWVCAK